MHWTPCSSLQSADTTFHPEGVVVCSLELRNLEEYVLGFGRRTSCCVNANKGALQEKATRPSHRKGIKALGWWNNEDFSQSSSGRLETLLKQVGLFRWMEEYGVLPPLPLDDCIRRAISLFWLAWTPVQASRRNQNGDLGGLSMWRAERSTCGLGTVP